VSMPKNYKHITMDERELIAKMHWEDKELSEIANALAGTRERYHGNSNETPLLNTDATPLVERNAEPMNGGRRQVGVPGLKTRQSVNTYWRNLHWVGLQS
jgi:hypothetical protein